MERDLVQRKGELEQIKREVEKALRSLELEAVECLLEYPDMKRLTPGWVVRS
jgi:hypothetical protein